MAQAAVTERWPQKVKKKVKKITPPKKIFFLHISSINAKILGETNFHAREFPRSGSKAKDGEREREKERLNDGDNNGQATHGECKPPGPIPFQLSTRINLM